MSDSTKVPTVPTTGPSTTGANVMAIVLLGLSGVLVWSMTVRASTGPRPTDGPTAATTSSASATAASTTAASTTAASPSGLTTSANSTTPVSVASVTVPSSIAPMPVVKTTARAVESAAPRASADAPLLRAAAPSTATAAPPSVASAAHAPPTAVASAAPTTTAKVTAPSPPAAASPTPLKTPQVVAIAGQSWADVAPGLLANGGVQTSPGSLFDQANLSARFAVLGGPDDIENALALGGEHPEGADIVMLPLPRFVAAYGELQALAPTVFFVAAWSHGDRGLQAKQADLLLKRPPAPVRLQGAAGDASTMLALHALDAIGLGAGQVQLVAGPEADLRTSTWATTKQQNHEWRTILTSRHAATWIPVVAIAKSRFLETRGAVAAEFVKLWLSGESQLRADASAAARLVAATSPGRSARDLIARLSLQRAASLRDNARAFGLSGSVATPLTALFATQWRLWRDHGVVDGAPPRAPLDTRIVAGLIRSGDKLNLPAAATTPPAAAGQRATILVQKVRASKTNADVDDLVLRLGALAAAFPEGRVSVSLFDGVKFDQKLSEALIATTAARFELNPAQFAAQSRKPQLKVRAYFEVSFTQ